MATEAMTLIAVVIDSYCLMMLMMLMLDVAVCLLCLMCLLLWLLAHTVDGCVDMDGCFVFALCLFLCWWTIERARLNTLLRSRVSLSLWLPTQR